MKFYRLLLIVGCLAVLTLLGASQESGIVIQVNCTDTNGCFHLLGQAIESAPEGATIQLSSGVFYEIPMLINRSLTIQGAGAQFTYVHAALPGNLFTVRSADHSITVNIKSITLQSRVVEVDPISSAVGIGIWIEGPLGGSPEQLKVFVLDSALIAVGTAVNVRGKAQLTLQGNWMRSAQAVLAAENGSQIIAEKNQMFLNEGFGIPRVTMVGLGDVEARFEGNRLAGTASQKVIGIFALGGQYSFEENRFTNHAVAVELGGKTTAEFLANEFDNNFIGIFLQTPPCVPSPAPELRFDGTISGSDNQFSFNSATDLCPSLGEYPWPEGFVKP